MGSEISYDDHVRMLEGVMAQQMMQQRANRQTLLIDAKGDDGCKHPMHIQFGLPCEIHGKNQEFAFACRHCCKQDEVHPDGIIRLAGGYYLCKICLRQHERKRFKFATEIITVCNTCIWEEIGRITVLNPGFFVDQMPPDETGFKLPGFKSP